MCFVNEYRLGDGIRPHVSSTVPGRNIMTMRFASRHDERTTERWPREPVHGQKEERVREPEPSVSRHAQ
jgi:hypothetical protein